MKKLLFLFTLLVLSISAWGTEIANGTCGDNVTWSLSDEGVLTISGNGSMRDGSWQDIDGIDVTDNTYGIYYSSIKSIVINDGVKSIGGSAFSGCSNLTSITIPSSVTKIEFQSFCGCSSLTTIPIPSSVTSIGFAAFDGCNSLTSITIPSSVTSIGDRTFMGCSNLTSITIPSSVTSIGIWAFADCSNLYSIQVDSDNKYFDSRDNCNAIIASSTNTLIAGCYNTNIPSSVTSIGCFAFDCCSRLTSIDIPSSVASIGEGAFEGCSNLTSISLPSSVTSIGKLAFNSCSNLTSISLPSSVTSIGEHAFYDCYNLSKLIVYASDIPNTDQNAFNGLNLVSVTLYVPQSSIEEYKTTSPWSEFGTILSIDELSKIYEIANGTCGDNVTWSLSNEGVLTISGSGIMRYADYQYYDGNYVTDNTYGTYYSSIKSVVVNDGVTNIGEGAFVGCSNLTSISLPSSVTSIGEGAFSNCSNLESISLPSSVTIIGDGAFNNCSSLSSISLPSSVTIIWNGAFQYCSSLESITIPSSVTIIGGAAFQGCSSLNSIVVDSNNKYYDSRNSCNAIIETSTNTLIAGCYNTVIPSSVTSIGDAAFSACYSLTSISIPSSVTSIGDCAFTLCSSLTSISIPSSVTSIGDCAFFGCSNLASITIPSSVESVGNYAFGDCNKLSKLIIYASDIPNIGEYIFMHTDVASATLYVPQSSIEKYKTTSPWSEFGTILCIEELPADVSQCDNIAYMNDVSTLAGKQISLSVQLKNKDDVYGYEFELSLPEGVTVSTITDSSGNTYPDVVLTETRSNASRHTLNATMVDDKLKVVCNSDPKETFANNEGEVAQIKINIPQGFVAGDYPITITNEKISLDGSTPTIKKIVSTLNVLEGKLGDANNDKVVNVGDITSIAGYILGDPDADFNIYAADANGDGNVNVGDISKVAGMILNGTANSAKARIATAEALNGFFSLPQLSMAAGEEVTIPVDLNTISGSFSSYQFDIIVPEGFVITDIIPNSARSSRLDSFRYVKLSDGTYRVLAYSTADSPVRGDEGALVYITLKANDTVAEGQYDLSVNSAVLANSKSAFSAPTASSVISVGNATSISTTNISSQTDDIFDVNGRKVSNINSASRGVYLVGGKKVVK